MNLRTVALASGLVGGACWLVRLVLDVAGAGGDRADEALSWAGLGLLAVAMVGFGAGLVSKSALWLRVIVGVAFPLLVWSVIEVFHEGGDAVGVDGVFGAVVALLSAIGLVRGRQHAGHRAAHGSHAR